MVSESGKCAEKNGTEICMCLFVGRRCWDGAVEQVDLLLGWTASEFFLDLKSKFQTITGFLETCLSGERDLCVC